MKNKDCPDREEWHGRFRGLGCRMTAGREAVIEVLSITKEHLSAEEIYNLAKKRNPELGLTTVYRTLERLSAMGEVYKFDFGDKRARFELARSAKGHHHHLVCTSCNAIIDYDDFIEDEVKLLKETEKKLSKKYNFKIEDHLLQFHGRCEKCSK